MKKSIFIVFAIFTALFFYSCSIQQINIGKPTQIEPQEIGLKSIKIKTSLPIENPNNFSFKIRKIKLDIFIHDQKIGEVIKTDKLKIKAKSNEIYSMVFEIKPVGRITDIMKIAGEFRKSSPQLDIRGNVIVSKLGIRKKISVDSKKILNSFK